jgi:hypothetical protein
MTLSAPGFNTKSLSAFGVRLWAWPSTAFSDRTTPPASSFTPDLLPWPLPRSCVKGAGKRWEVKNGRRNSPHRRSPIRRRLRMVLPDPRASVLECGCGRQPSTAFVCRTDVHPTYYLPRPLEKRQTLLSSRPREKGGMAESDSAQTPFPNRPNSVSPINTARQKKGIASKGLK